MSSYGSEIYNVEELLGLRKIRARALYSPFAHINSKDFGHMLKGDISKRISALISECEAFFKVKNLNVEGIECLEYSAECFVLTLDELCELKREAFKNGLRHSQHFIGLPGTHI